MEGSAATRIDSMEDRISQLESRMQAQHTQQSIHNQEVANRINVVQTQVEQQSITMQQYFDTKLSEQLSQIEGLLNKSRKTE